MTSTPTTSRRSGARFARHSCWPLPLVFGHVSTGLIVFVDSVLAGRHSATTLAAVAVGSAIWSVAIMVLIGILLALPPTVSQLDGAGRRRDIARVFRQAVWLALGLSALLFAFMSLAGWMLPALGIAQPRSSLMRAAFLHGIRWALPRARALLPACAIE